LAACAAGRKIMPKYINQSQLDDDTMTAVAIPASHYGYSAVSPANLTASEYTLVSICIDSSGSVASFRPQLEECLQRVVQSCRYSPRADNLLLRIVQFHDSQIKQLHGFKMLEFCNAADYRNVLVSGGWTNLYDATYNAVVSTLDYADQLRSQKYASNAVIFILSDGLDNKSKLGPADIRKALTRAIGDERIDSINTILVGVNITEPHIGRALADFKDKAGLNQYEELGNMTPERSARLADFVSRSISAQAQAIGTGGPSLALTF